MLEYNLGEFIDKIEEISGRATKEYALEKSLEKMKSDWEGVEFTLLPYRDTVCCYPIACFKHFRSGLKWPRFSIVQE